MATIEKIYDVLVIGAGPAGITASLSAAEGGASVVLLEKNPYIGKKILATGNGRCNITNKNVEIQKYHGDPELAISIIRKFDQNETISYFESLGLLLKEEDRGRMFPITNQASSVVKILEEELKNKRVTVKTGCEIRKIIKNNNFFEITDTKNIIYKCRSLIIATGGKAAHQFGSSGDGLYWAKNFGHTIAPIYAALVPIETNTDITKTLQGLKIEGKISAFSSSQQIAESSGDILFTHYGLSGPAVMSIARLIAPFLEKKKVILKIDLFPEKRENELDQMLEKILKDSGTKSIRNSLLGLLPQKLIPILLAISMIHESKKSAEISKKLRLNLVKNMKKLEFEVSKIRPLKEAQVTAGGVDTNEINADTLESKIVKGLYFAGEILNVDADSGGYNLQWCWSSGKIAGNSASQNKK